MKNTITNALIALIIITLTFAATVAAQINDTLPTLRGEEAIEKLKETGQYDSLRDAFNAARKRTGRRAKHRPTTPSDKTPNF